MQAQTEVLGIIAGEGKMPIYIAHEAAQKGVRVVAVILKGNAREEDFRDVAAASCTIRLGQLGERLRTGSRGRLYPCGIHRHARKKTGVCSDRQRFVPDGPRMADGRDFGWTGT